MDDTEEKFHNKKKKLELFKNDLKNVFVRHNIVLKHDSEQYLDGYKDVIKVYINGDIWYNDDFNELIEELNIIEK